ncbi:sugar kinase [Streptomyces sp. 8K308]|uniref:sugar kinase n=1 Tax=Streptomyces sp. 8K308 TaxID=2530388 RepID=UPI001FB6CBE6|nr:sugar kinase [Streptomyces sp. 8K308]
MNTQTRRTPVTHTDALTIGETMAMVTPEAGARLDADSTFLLRPGGAESNVAALLAELGHRTHWASALGADRLGDVIVTALAGHGVDTSLVRRDPRRPTGVYFKDPTPEGTRVSYYRAGSAASGLGPADVTAWTALRPRVVHLSGILPALSPDCAALARHIVFDRPWGDVPVSFDVNHRPVLWSGADGGAAETLLELARRSDLVFVGRDEAEALWGTTDAESVRALVDGPERLVVKDAAVEAVAFTGTRVTRVPSRRVRVVDAVGAGDAFAAGWLSGWLDGRDETLCLRLGHYAAAQVLASPSDFARLPRAEEIVTTLADESAAGVPAAGR